MEQHRQQRARQRHAQQDEHGADVQAQVVVLQLGVGAGVDAFCQGRACGGREEGRGQDVVERGCWGWLPSR